MVLAVVHEVGQDSASVFLHPLVEVTIDRAEVTSNDLDDLRDLMSPGEVLPVRVAATGPTWRLSLLDIDDEEISTDGDLAPGRRARMVAAARGRRRGPPTNPHRPRRQYGHARPATEALAVEESLAAIEEVWPPSRPLSIPPSPAPTRARAR